MEHINIIGTVLSLVDVSSKIDAIRHPKNPVIETTPKPCMEETFLRVKFFFFSIIDVKINESKLTNTLGKYININL